MLPGADRTVPAPSITRQPLPELAEADGNRTRLTEILGHVGFEDRGGHQAPLRLPHSDILPGPPGRAPGGEHHSNASVARRGPSMGR
jgi:hypothetical protein